ncbi:MAG: type II CRISPR RNA-guided endonuclease Cas9 [Clostridiales bacterium]|nr:type II CRISPR RNA-guided endonuclease Cas9 [Clostridiales bacterium]
MSYSIGLDIGIASVGSAVVLLDEKDEPFRIYKMASRVFEKAENPKDGSSLAAPRREFRGSRRRLRRKRHRKENIKLLIEKSMGVSRECILELCENSSTMTDIYQVRSQALDKKLNRDDFIRLLIHLSQRRGFKSNRKADSQDKKSEAGALLSAVESNTRLLEEKHYRTIGEMLYKDEKFAVCKRNKSESYSNTFSRKQYEDEVKLIFESQRNLKNEFATAELEKCYLKIYLGQRSFDDGPGGNSPYAGNQIEKMLGKCRFEENELRAVKASFSFEYFNLLSKVNAVKIVSGSDKRPLSKEERDIVIKLAFDKNSITYASIRKALKLPDNDLFNISYNDSDFEKTEKKTKFTYLTAFHTFKKAYGDSFLLWSTEKRNNLAYALSVYKNDEKIICNLRENGFTDAEIDIALTLPSFSKTANLSLKALDKINPYLEQGMLYNDACEAAGYDFKKTEKDQRRFLPANPKDAPELADINNPVVRRAVSQSIKVINAIIREMGESPAFVKIELARELSKNFKDRKSLEKFQKENHAENERIMEELKSKYGLLRPTGQDLIKYKLWKEQDGICPYSLQPIKIERLFEIGYTDIDHIIPYSISFDDSYSNKVLVMSSENRQKGNRIPMQYLTGKRRDDFYIWVDSSNLGYKKKKNLLKEKLTEEDTKGFKERNLNDTQYISRFMLKFIKKYLETAPNNTGIKNTVSSVNGAATAYVRKRWGIHKIRENGDVHHAIDAVVIACITPGMIKRISEYSKYRETEFFDEGTGRYFDVDRKTGEVIDRFPLPYPDFRQEIEMLCSDNPSHILHNCPLVNYSTDEELKPIFVSRMPNRKVTGSAHQDTIRAQIIEDGVKYTVSKVPLTSLKLENGEIKDYFNPSSDMLLYNALKERLIQFGGKADAAFAEPFYKPKNDGTLGPLVKKVKIREKATLSVNVHNKTAVAANGSTVRTDVFMLKVRVIILCRFMYRTQLKMNCPIKLLQRTSLMKIG